MTKIILDKRKYEQLIKLEEDFDWELNKSRNEQREWYEKKLFDYKTDIKITMWMLYTLSLLELIYILIK